MKLSTRARYGLRAMLALSLCKDGAPGKTIAEMQNLPAAYLEQLMSRLRSAKLVVAIRGMRGKYVLARNPETISLAQIVEALEGPINIGDCADVPNCGISPEVCILREIFKGADKALYDFFDGITLAELSARQQEREKHVPRMYYI